MTEVYVVGLWKVVKNSGKEFKQRVEFRLKNGRNIQFWKERWCSEDSLDKAFLKLQ